MKKLITLFVLLTAWLLLTGLLLPEMTLAQGAPPPTLPGKPVQTPIDGGLALLAVAGGAYAVKKFRERKA